MATQTRPNPQARKEDPGTFRRTAVRNRFLRILAECYCSTVRDLAWFIYGDTEKSTIRNVQKVIQLLRKQRYLNSLTYEPEDPEDYQAGSIPKVFGLSKEGVDYANRHFPESEPIEFKRDRSRRTLEHDMKVARVQLRFIRVCDQRGLEPFCKKTDLYRKVTAHSFVDPDRLFGAYDPKTDRAAYFFLELENEKKNFEALYAKCEPYQTLFKDPGFCLKQWGDFGTFKVWLQFRTDERKTNFMRHLAGECHCTFYRGKKKHTCRPDSKLKQHTFWFTTDHKIYNDMGGMIFVTPYDYVTTSYSFLDL